MQRQINSSIRQTTEIRNFMESHILGSSDPNKVIDKKLIEMIMPSAKLPVMILSQPNELIYYINKNARNQVEQFRQIYENSQHFKITKYGQFCINDSDRYILFSEFMVAFIQLTPRAWAGFCYKNATSAHVGEFSDMKSQGNGKGLFVFQHKDHSRETRKILYHQFRGTWKGGQIVHGERITYQSYKQKQQRPLMIYTGNFINFAFHDTNGILKKRQKTTIGKFEKGVYIKQQGEQQNLRAINQSGKLE